MVDERLTDGTRIAELFASEIEGGVGALATLDVVDADPDVTPTADGALAYRLVRTETAAGRGKGRNGRGADATGDGAGDDTPSGSTGRDRFAEVFVHPDRARIELLAGGDAAVRAAEEAQLRVRPKEGRPPRTLVFVEDGAQVKRVVTVLESALAAADAR